MSCKKEYDEFIKNIKSREKHWYDMANNHKRGSETWLMWVHQANVLTNILNDYVYDGKYGGPEE